MQPIFKLSPGPLLNSGLGPLARYCTHQKTICGRPEQAYLPSDPRLEWPDEVSLFKLDPNKRQWLKLRTQFESPESLFKSGLGPLARYGIHQKIINGSERNDLPSDQRLEWPAERPLFKPACFRKIQIAYPDR